MKDGGRPGRPKIWLMKTSSGRLAFHLTFRNLVFAVRPRKEPLELAMESERSTKTKNTECKKRTL